MKFQFIKFYLTIMLASGIFISELNATGGYLRHGYGVKYSALAGAGTALSLSSFGAANNPAGLVFLGDRYEINIALFSPNRDYTITGNPSQFPGTFGLTPGTVESESKFFPLPSLGANFMLTDNMALGLALYGNGGMNTDHETATFHDQTSGETGVNLEQMFFGATYSIEFAENHAFGVTALFGFQRFAAKGLGTFTNFSSDATKLTGSRVSTATGFGGRIGYQGQLLPYLRLGASFQTKVYMSEFDEYAGLFAEKGDFDVPMNWNAGIAVNPTCELTLALDVQQILYSGIASINNTMDLINNSPMLPNGTPNPNYQALGTDEGWGFGWDDIFVFKFGVMYEGVKNWTFMAGYSYGEQPMPESEVMFNILAPGVIQHHITFGLSKLINNNHELNVAFMYAPSSNVVGPNPLEAPNQQTIEIQMSQWQLEVGYAFN
jgi:long-chain fatty acid transport protein